MKNKRWWWWWNERTFLLCYTFACMHTQKKKKKWSSVRCCWRSTIKLKSRWWTWRRGSTCLVENESESRRGRMGGTNWQKLRRGVLIQNLCTSTPTFILNAIGQGPWFDSGKNFFLSLSSCTTSALFLPKNHKPSVGVFYLPIRKRMAPVAQLVRACPS